VPHFSIQLYGAAEPPPCTVNGALSSFDDEDNTHVANQRASKVEWLDRIGWHTCTLGDVAVESVRTWQLNEAVLRTLTVLLLGYGRTISTDFSAFSTAHAHSPPSLRDQRSPVNTNRL